MPPLHSSGLVVTSKLPQGNGRLFAWEHMWVGTSGDVTPEGIPVLKNGVLRSFSNAISIFADDLKAANLTTLNRVIELTRRGGLPYPMVYDRVVRCLGWKHGKHFYTTTGDADDGTNTIPTMQYNGKYPVMTSEYESANVPGMYFAGQLAHGKDHMRSAGGFIHGFRYTARALYRILESKRHLEGGWPEGGRAIFLGIQDWDGGIGMKEAGCNPGDWIAPLGAPENCNSTSALPATTTAATKNTTFESMLDKLFARINTASGPYQMASVLGDGIVFSSRSNGKGKAVTADFWEEVPFEYFNAKFSKSPRLYWQFGYETQRQSLHDSRRFGTLFQILVWWFHPTTAAEESAGIYRKEVLRLGEDLSTNWNSWETRTRVGEWIYSKVQDVCDSRDSSSKCGGNDGDDDGAQPGDQSAMHDNDHPPKDAADIIGEAQTKLVQASATRNSACAAGGLKSDCETAAATLVAAQAEIVAMLERLDNGGSLVPPSPPSKRQHREEQQRRKDRSDVTLDELLDGLEPTTAAAATPGKWRDSKTTPRVSLQNGDGIAPGYGDLDWVGALQSIAACTRASSSAKDAGSAVGISPKTFSIRCALEYGRQWPTGRVEVNIANHHSNATLSVWQGSTLAPTTDTIPVGLLAPGQGRRYQSHQGEVWLLKDGDSNVLKKLVVDVGKGVVQDFVLDGRGAPKDLASSSEAQMHMLMRM